MQDRVLVVASGLVRFANWLNWAVAVGFVVAIVASFVFGDALTARLVTKYHGHYIGETIGLLRLTGVLGLVACVAVYHLFNPLLAILATVRAGDPFVVANADRLQRIGWALFAIQLFDLALGGIVLALDRIGVDHATWVPGFTGWIGVVMLFVLARVFRVGAGMRDDLAMTV
ncbi:DUF2975 domain-containing protein [Sphingomonas sp. PP-CE-1G-424]|uniref:DUF2975 domain-containing protein n=1 Tax=Sphingomonas sp. PP-CE-1G-424 TaxID=2135658 RepID=UPI001054C616|nr:DUF2975 domain-containing protein [Sphingomonas sp. PP-CE-1G-424]TCP66852.1 hypothetical protein C8J43_104307 [Sphingomonas sp. PP-CE-1G-424]